MNIVESSESSSDLIESDKSSSEVGIRRFEFERRRWDFFFFLFYIFFSRFLIRVSFLASSSEDDSSTWLLLLRKNSSRSWPTMKLSFSSLLYASVLHLKWPGSSHSIQRLYLSKFFIAFECSKYLEGLSLPNDEK